ncbi:MAG: MotA/TolQ/ExbB proton channel family protein [Myxococcales bacterium]|nr:MotA/TolQ/ExbB proton channel family protein [Myxococcales bacterium]
MRLQEPAAPPPIVELDPLSLVVNASGPVAAVLWLLVAAAIAAWVITILKLRQHGRWRAAEEELELATVGRADAPSLAAAADAHPDAPGAPVLRQLCKRAREPDALAAVAARALTEQQQRLSSMMTALSSIGSASPFVGLFGTVYGIMDAFLRIGRERSATLPVVAPAIGEALIATAVGLFAAIPAVIAFNALAKRQDDLLARVEAAAREWVVVLARRE